MNKFIIVLILLTLLLTACSSNIGKIENGYTNFGNLRFPQFQPPNEGEEIAVITTSKGVIKAKLLEQAAPIAVEKFKEWVNEEEYTDSFFANIRKDRTIMIHKKGYTKNMSEEETERYFNDLTENMDFGYDYVLETNDDYIFFSGAIGFAHYNSKIVKDKPIGTFFIVTNEGLPEEILDLMENMPEEYEFTQDAINAYRDIGGVMEYNGSYVVFGQVFYGMDIVYQISNMPVDQYKYPIEKPVIIEKVQIVKYKGK